MLTTRRLHYAYCCIFILLYSYYWLHIGVHVNGLLCVAGVCENKLKNEMATLNLKISDVLVKIRVEVAILSI